MENLDPAYKMDLDFWDFLEGKKTLSYNRRNTVFKVTYSLPLCGCHYNKGKQPVRLPVCFPKQNNLSKLKPTQRKDFALKGLF